MEYKNYTAYQHGSEPAVGVLITNLGTPDAPTKEALKPYLKEFLMDPRVVEPPPARWLWKLILNLIILNTRPAKSAEAYEEVWGHYGEGSPLLDISNRQLADIEERCAAISAAALNLRWACVTAIRRLPMHSNPCRNAMYNA